jgi:SGNH hydrolase-like domain, acetyltransferase AlgX
MPRRHQLVFIGWFLALIYAVPIFQTAADLVHGRRPQVLDVFTARPTRANLRAFERRLEDSSLAARAARPWMQLAWFTGFQNAGETVIVGRDGWLFYRPDMRYLVEPPPPADPLQAILAFRDQLAARGIRLMVLAVPGKPSIYPEELTSRVDGTRLFRSPTLDLLASLHRAGIEAPDLFHELRHLGHRSYLLRDTHWSAEAARLAADSVAHRIRELGWVAPGAVEYTERPILAQRQSDIVRMIRNPQIEDYFPKEPVPCFQVWRKDTGELYRDDPDSPVLLLGDSFLRIYQTDQPRAAGFIAHLARSLHRPLASIVNDGGASTLVRQELSRRSALLRGKKLVIWEFVERDLRFGTEGWKQVALPKP